MQIEDSDEKAVNITRTDSDKNNMVGEELLAGMPVYTYNQTYSQETHEYLHNDASQAINETLNIVSMCFVPSIIVIGCLGNFIFYSVFTTSKLKKLSAAPYCVGIALSDSFFLLSLIIQWLLSMDIPVYNIPIWCHLWMFISQSSHFMSTWLVVGLSIDRYVTIALPWTPCFIYLQDHVPDGGNQRAKHRSLCSTMKAKICVVAIAITGIVIFMNTSLMYGDINLNGQYMCLPLPEYGRSHDLLNKLDIFFNMLLPFIIITLTNLLILRTLVYRRAYSRKLLTVPNRVRQLRSSSHLQNHVTFLSVALCLTFLVLRSPSQALRIYITVQQMVHAPYQFIYTNDLVRQKIFQYVFYLGFIMNTPIAFAVSRNFRSAFGALYVKVFGKCCKSRSRERRRTISRAALEFTFQFSSKLMRLNDPSAV